MFAEKLEVELDKVLKKLQIKGVKIAFEHPANLNFGDYSTNIALIAAKLQGKNPRELAEEIAKTWRELSLPDFVEKIEVAGPGFINIWLKFSALGTQLAKVLERGDQYGSSKQGKGQTVVIDYSAPNIAKPFGIGHLRSTNIGQALYNLYRFLGWKTIGDNHLGDWGTQFGSLIVQIKKAEREGLRLNDLTVADLEKMYVQFHKEAADHPELEEEARAWFRRLEDGDEEARRIWQTCVDISLKEFDWVYQLLGVKIDYAYGESFYLDKMAAVLDDCRKKGLLKESKGAQVVEISGMKVPAMLVKSDGATTYLLRDLATIRFRRETWQPDLYLYEVGADQALYFAQVFAIAAMLSYGQKDQFIHIAHGLIRWATGKFSTRRGVTIHLEEVLGEAISRAKEIMTQAGVAKDLASEEQAKVARAVGIGGIKYNDLKQNPRTDIIFDWNQILTFSGNSGPYLQYTYARIQSVLKKASQAPGKFVPPAGLSPEETALLRTIYQFPEVIIEAAKVFSPNLLCHFLFDLAQKFNLFYDKQRIIGSDNEQFRLSLAAASGQVLKNGLTLLGIETLERM
ncbi:MAG TPA: arginine--tRNA ligase [Patescibacteria group bacterium]|nr:arginine--tRNA ligase [Patescibacteria group bacterium]